MSSTLFAPESLVSLSRELICSAVHVVPSRMFSKPRLVNKLVLTYLHGTPLSPASPALPATNGFHQKQYPSWAIGLVVQSLSGYDAFPYR